MVKQYQDGITGFERFMEIMMIESDTEHSPTAVELSHAKGDVEFRKVSFKYRDSSDYVLKDLSFSVQAGEYVSRGGDFGSGQNHPVFLDEYCPGFPEEPACTHLR